MNRKLAIIIFLQAIIIVTLFGMLVFYGKDEYETFIQAAEEEEIETPDHITLVEGKTLIEVNQATQRQSAIITSPLQATSFQENILSYGKVLSIASLIDLRTQYLTTLADTQIYTQAVAAKQQEYDRLYALNQDDKNVADKVVIQAKQALEAEKTKLAVVRNKALHMVDNMRQHWGNRLATLATQSTSSTLDHLIKNKSVLIEVTLPFSAHQPPKGSRITIAPTSALQKTVKATYFSAAPGNSNQTMQGKTYFYLASASFLRADMPLKVLDYTTLGEAAKGVFIPNKAVVWYAGKPWIYQKTDDTTFMRLPINNDTEIDDGWFYQGSLQANDEIVTSGAQLLLSEEFKYQITNENDD